MDETYWGSDWDVYLDPSTAGIDYQALADLPIYNDYAIYDDTIFNDYEAFQMPDYSASANPVLAEDPTTWPPEIQNAWLAGDLDGIDAGQLATQSTDFTQAVTAAQQEGLAALQMGGVDPSTIGYDETTGQLYTKNEVGSWVPLDPNAPVPASVSTAERLREIEAQVAQGVPREQAIANTSAQAPQTWGQMLSGAFGALNGILSTPAGKLLGALGIGGATLGLSQALAGNVAQVKPAALPNAATATQAIGLGQGALVSAYQQGGQADLAGAFRGGMAGEKTLADLLNLQATQEIGAQQAETPLTAPIRTAALGQIPGQMNATTNPNIVGTGQLGEASTGVARSLVPGAGEIGGGIGQQIRNVLSGNYSNPILENNIKRRREEFEARQYAQLGPGWQTSTPGMQAQEQQDLLEESLRFQDQQQTIANYTPLYNAIIQNQATIGTGATSQIQAAQQQGLNQNVALSQLGRTPAGSLATNLGTITPPTALAALGPASATTQQIGSQAFDAARANALSENQANQALSTGIGALGGAIAGNLTKQTIAAGV